MPPQTDATDDMLKAWAAAAAAGGRQAAHSLLEAIQDLVYRLALRQASSQGAAAPAPTISFPSKQWFEGLAALMKAQRPMHEKLGYLDATVRCTVLDGGGDETPWSVQLHFEEFEVLSVTEAATEPPDFTMAASMQTWRAMIESIAEGKGRPALQQTLNDLNMRSGELRVEADDPLQRQLFFRYNQSLQAFVNASASFHTVFVRGA